MKKEQYHPEPYWSRVAQEIEQRASGELLAGDNEPYYDYKRKKFLKMLHSLDFQDKSVLEIGCGPGGNLIELLKRSPERIQGVDISSDMIRIAEKNTQGTHIHVQKIDGTSLPFENDSFDIVFTATVLQHNSDDEMMKRILQEACRVSREKVVLFEKLDSKRSGDDLCVARPIKQYEAICKPLGFELQDVEHINIRPSYYISGIIRKTFNPKTYKEGEKPSSLTPLFQNLTLPITKILDPIFTSKKDVGKLVFQRLSA